MSEGSKRSKEELIRVIELLDSQIEACDNDKLRKYKPHAIQDRFHRSGKRIRLFVAGNRIGKTASSVMESIWLATGLHPYHPIKIPCKGKLYAVSYGKVVETILPKLEQYLPKSVLAKKAFDKNERGQIVGVNFATGSKVRIGSYDQALMKAEGSDYDFVGFDEPPSRDLYVAEMRGLVDRNGLMWFSMTPLSEAWIFDDLWIQGMTGEKDYIDCFSGSSYDNPYIDKESVAFFASELTNEEKAVRIEGQFRRLQGLVIKTFDSTLGEVEAFPLTSKFSIYEGLDPHTEKPNCALWKAIDADGFRYAVKELKFDGGIYDFGQELAAYREELREQGAEVICSISDTSLNQKDMQFKINMKDELCRSLRDAGESVMPMMANKRNWLDAGIKKLIDLHRPIDRGGWKSPTEFLFKDCVKSYKYELLHYQWPKNLSREIVRPIPKFNEMIDCSRYIESVAPKFRTPGESGLVRTYNGAYSRLESRI